MNIVAALGMAALMAGPFSKPTAVGPQVSTAAAEAERQNQLMFILESRFAEEERVHAIAHRLLQANADLCPETRLRAGITADTIESFRGPMRAVAVRKWGLSEQPRIVSLTPGGAGQLAGLEPGDELVSVDGQPVASGRKATQRWVKQVAVAMEKSPGGVRLGIRRAGEAREVTVVPMRVCGYDVIYDADSQVLSASADGRRILITRPMYKLASSDDELAVVLGHELAHNARRHIQASQKNATTAMLGGAVLDILVTATTGVDTGGAISDIAADFGAQLYSPEFEAEADYVGMYFVARAGFSIEGVEKLWRKMGAENPESIFLRSSHPPTAERYLALAATREEINAKGGDAASLRPNEVAKPTPTASR